MLAIGNAVNTYYLGLKDIDNSVLEYICWTEEETKQIQKLYKLKKRHICHKNLTSKTYETLTHIVTIHDGTAQPYFNNVKKDIPVIIGKQEVATPFFTYVWSKMKAKFLHVNIEEWEINMKTCSTIYNNIIKQSKLKVNFKTRLWESHLAIFGATGFGTKRIPFEFKEYKIITEDSLLELYRYQGHDSIWKKCLLETHNIGLTLSCAIFKRLSDSDKLGLTMERLYTDCTNEYILEEFVYGNYTEKPTAELFKVAIMNRCSQESYIWFSDYIIQHYNQIMEEFDPRFVDELYDAIKYNNLEKVG